MTAPKSREEFLRRAALRAAQIGFASLRSGGPTTPAKPAIQILAGSWTK